MKKIFILFLFIVLGSINTTNALLHEEVSCGVFGTNANSCDQCFDGGNVYEGKPVSLEDTFINESGYKNVYYEDENRGMYSSYLLNSSSNWGISSNLLKYNITPSQGSKSGRSVYVFENNTRTDFLVSNAGKGIIFNGHGSSSDRNTAEYKVSIKTKYHNWDGGSYLSNVILHEECVFYKPAWCGDGVRDSAYETCDPNDTSNIGWGSGGCSATCEPITVTNPSCGDGVINGTEECDYNDATETNWGTGTPGCTNTCEQNNDSDSDCGDGVYEPALGEECDYNDTTETNWGTGTPGCTNTCEQDNDSDPDCGDGVYEPALGEECDYNDTTETNWGTGTPGCTNTCEQDNDNGGDFCGDGDRNNGERCDPADTSRDGWGSKGCSATCSPLTGGGPTCNVNGIVGPNETCDPEDPDELRWGSRGCNSYCRPLNGSGGGNCGDGFLDITEGEECDLGTENGGEICSNSCKIKKGGGGEDNGEITFPSEGSIIFGPEGNYLIGDGMDVYEEYSLLSPYIKNETNEELYFDYLCVGKTTSSVSLTGNLDCRLLNRVLGPNQTIYFNTLANYSHHPIFKGYVDGIPDGEKTGENKIITTIRNDGVLYSNAYFRSALNVTVARPTIATTGGGTSYISDTSEQSDVNDLTTTKKDENKNFVGVGVSPGDTSSYSKEVNNSEVIESAENDGITDIEIIEDDTDIVTATIETKKSIDDFTSYRGIENAYIIRDENFEINLSNIDDIVDLSSSKTYIIENGNLEIKTNISSDYNIAFVVKGGDIKISDNVTQMDGTYISIPNESNVGGKIISEPSIEQLIVNGSLYGDTTNLISNRTYIKENKGNGLIDVGTVVSFGSSIFRDPAPLTTQFISEYMEAAKVAQ